MNTESQFVYDWLKLNIKFLQINNLVFGGWNMKSESDEYSLSKESKHTTTVDFAIRRKGSGPFHPPLQLEVPAYIPLLSIYRALIELREEMKDVKFTIDDKHIAESLGSETLYDRLRKVT